MDQASNPEETSLYAIALDIASDAIDDAIQDRMGLGEALDDNGSLVGLTDTEAVAVIDRLADDLRSICAQLKTSWIVGASTLRDMADRIDRGPDVPLPPSVYSALVRERADELEGGADRA